MDSPLTVKELIKALESPGEVIVPVQLDEEGGWIVMVKIVKSDLAKQLREYDPEGESLCEGVFFTKNKKPAFKI